MEITLNLNLHLLLKEIKITEEKPNKKTSLKQKNKQTTAIIKSPNRTPIQQTNPQTVKQCSDLVKVRSNSLVIGHSALGLYLNAIDDVLSISKNT